MSPADAGAQHPLQPLLNDAVIALRAPTQAWSGRSGDMGDGAMDGVFHGDVRHVRAVRLRCDGSAIEWISVAPNGPSEVVFGGLLRGLDDTTPDPKVRLRRERTVADGTLTERYAVESKLPAAVATELVVRLAPDFASLHDVKAGVARPAAFTVADTETGVEIVSDETSIALSAPGGDIRPVGDEIEVRWPLRIPPFGRAEVSWTIELRDPSLVVHGARGRWPAAPLEVGRATDSRLRRWLAAATGDLDALRLTLAGQPGDPFFAAGAPWFLTLFGRDSLWAARLSLPAGTTVAASTLRVLARLQGSVDDAATAQEPGKILHELRATALEIPGEDIVLPPLYYGSVDSTPLWVCLLADAWRAGMPEPEVRALVPALRRALRWILRHGDSDGDGFLDYIDRSGRGLANQGWKDSGDSIQWRDGRLADGPIALCEVQGYAYEAALGGADLLEAFGDVQPGGGDDAHGDLSPGALREWAAGLKDRFAESYWVETPEGRYPAVALDRHKRPVDSLTSNIGHLLGTGILDPEDERGVAALLGSPSMSTGFGIRTMSTGAAGYWPLSYHGGSVWTHDTAIVARGMARAGLRAEAVAVVDGLLAAADGFAYRVPELHAGDPASETSVPTPYPAACRPQAWSAAAAVACLAILDGG